MHMSVTGSRYAQNHAHVFLMSHRKHAHVLLQSPETLHIEHHGFGSRGGGSLATTLDVDLADFHKVRPSRLLSNMLTKTRPIDPQSCEFWVIRHQSFESFVHLLPCFNQHVVDVRVRLRHVWLELLVTEPNFSLLMPLKSWIRSRLFGVNKCSFLLLMFLL